MENIPLKFSSVCFRPPSQHEEVNLRRRRTNILLACITIVFFVGWAPMVIFTLIYDFANHWLPKRASMVSLAYALSLLSGYMTTIGKIRFKILTYTRVIKFTHMDFNGHLDT